VLYAPNILSTGLDAETAHLLFDAARRLTAALNTMATPPRLFLLIPEINSEHQDDPAQAILWGLGRMLALAHPDIWGGIFELADSVLIDNTDDAGDPVQDSAAPVRDIKDIWRICEPDLRRSLLRDHVAVLVAAVMGLPSMKALNPSADFFELGMDSLMNVLLQRALAETLGEMLDQAVVFDYPTVEELAEHLATIGDADQELAEANFSERVN
jgi:acyl carrier protein